MRTAKFLLLVALTGVAPAEEQIRRPFLIWTAKEAEHLAQTIRSRPWAEACLRQLQATPAAERHVLDNHLLHLAFGDQEAAKVERQVLLHFAEMCASPAYENGREVDIGTGVITCVNYDIAFRYDLFHQALSPEERRACEVRFRNFSHVQVGNRAGPHRTILWEHPLGMSACFLALALATADRRLVRDVFEQAVKPYFDRMVDGCLNPDGCNPDLKMVGAMWLWCRAVSRLGLDDLGFNYTSEHGGCFRRLMEGFYLVADPAVAVPGGTPFIGRSAVTLSERLRRAGFSEVEASSYAMHHGGGVGVTSVIAAPGMPHPRQIFRAPLIVGRLADGRGGWPTTKPYPASAFYSYDKEPRLLVGVPQITYNRGFNPESLDMLLPQVFELCHQRWPEAGFDWFLARMTAGDSYCPTLYWGLDRVEAATTRPPALRSLLLPELGMALLRAEEGPGFWDSPAPYAVLRLVDGKDPRPEQTALSLHALHAFHRPIYLHELPTGVQPWDAVGKEYSTVIVDNQPRPGTGKGSTRHRFDPLVKFVAARSSPFTYTTKIPGDQPLTMVEVDRVSGMAAGVDMERALALTREYLVDLVRVTADRPHTYDWLVNAPGSAQVDAGTAWQATDALDQTLGVALPQRHGTIPNVVTFALKHSYVDQQGLDPQAGSWSLNLVQTALADPAKTQLGAEWYGRQVGARITMLGEAGTRVFHARRPLPRRLTTEEQQQLQDLLFPKRLGGRSKAYDDADRQVTEFTVPPPSAASAAPGNTPTTAAADGTFRPVGALAGGHPETGGVVVVAERNATNTLFVALHEPFERLAWSIDTLRRIQQTEDAIGVAVRGRGQSAVDDRILIRLGDQATTPVTLSDGEERFTFQGFAYVRIGARQVSACGDLSALRVRIPAGTPTLVVNGTERPATVAGGWMEFAP